MSDREFLDSIDIGKIEPGAYILTVKVPSKAYSWLRAQDGSAMRKLGEMFAAHDAMLFILPVDDHDDIRLTPPAKNVERDPRLVLESAAQTTELSQERLEKIVEGLRKLPEDRPPCTCPLPCPRHHWRHPEFVAP